MEKKLWRTFRMWLIFAFCGLLFAVLTSEPPSAIQLIKGFLLVILISGAVTVGWIWAEPRWAPPDRPSALRPRQKPGVKSYRLLAFGSAGVVIVSYVGVIVLQPSAWLTLLLVVIPMLIELSIVAVWRVFHQQLMAQGWQW